MILSLFTYLIIENRCSIGQVKHAYISILCQLATVMLPIRDTYQKNEVDSHEENFVLPLFTYLIIRN